MVEKPSQLGYTNKREEAGEPSLFLWTNFSEFRPK